MSNKTDYRFKPQSDITAYELAQIIEYSGLRWAYHIYEDSGEIKRHFDYDPEDAA